MKAPETPFKSPSKYFLETPSHPSTSKFPHFAIEILLLVYFFTSLLSFFSHFFSLTSSFASTTSSSGKSWYILRSESVRLAFHGHGQPLGSKITVCAVLTHANREIRSPSLQPHRDVILLFTRRSESAREVRTPSFFSVARVGAVRIFVKINIPTLQYETYDSRISALASFAKNGLLSRFKKIQMLEMSDS